MSLRFLAETRRVIVIGSGPAGAVAALTLVQHGVPVTMLESGLPIEHGLVVRALGRNIFRKWPAEQKTDSAFLASGDPGTTWWSTLAPGGLSNFWTGAVPRFAAEDFDEGERLHERYRWPIQYVDLAPYYTRMERLLGVVGERRAVANLPPPEIVQEHTLTGGWRSIAATADARGQGLVRVPLADGPRWMIRKSGNAFNSFRGIVSRLLKSRDFELILGAHATRLEWNPSTSRVDAVEYVDRTTLSSHRVQASAVVLAAGPLGSTKLLLQSTSHDFPEGLGNSQGLVGQFLHDHPTDWSELQLERALPVLDHTVYLTRAPYKDSPPLFGAEIVLGGLSKLDRLLSLTPRTERRFGVVTFGTMVPTFDNHVRLHSDQKDSFGLPVLEIHMHYGSQEYQNIRMAQERMLSILRAAGYQATLRHTVERMVPGYSNHYAGTVRMHVSPRYGVLNGWNRLHDVDNVAVVDASSFTTGPEKNPTLTIMALAARAAERLAEDLKRDAVRVPNLSGYAVPDLRQH
jgi:choline dehydrogenase-like flavoprotein